MGWDIHIADAAGEVIQSKHDHFVRGSVYAVGGSNLLQIAITFNYGAHFSDALGADFRATFSGLSVADSVPILSRAIMTLPKDDDDDQDYWAPTSENARRALLGMLELAVLAELEGTWCVA